MSVVARADEVPRGHQVMGPVRAASIIGAGAVAVADAGGALWRCWIGRSDELLIAGRSGASGRAVCASPLAVVRTIGSTSEVAGIGWVGSLPEPEVQAVLGRGRSVRAVGATGSIYETGPGLDPVVVERGPAAVAGVRARDGLVRSSVIAGPEATAESVRSLARSHGVQGRVVSLIVSSAGSCVLGSCGVAARVPPVGALAAGEGAITIVVDPTGPTLARRRSVRGWSGGTLADESGTVLVRREPPTGSLWWSGGSVLIGDDLWVCGSGEVFHHELAEMSVGDRSRGRSISVGSAALGIAPTSTGIAVAHPDASLSLLDDGDQVSVLPCADRFLGTLRADGDCLGLLGDGSLIDLGRRP